MSLNALIGVVLLLVFTTPIFAQRHGRPDSAQNYAKSIPDATLTIRTPTSTTHLRRGEVAAYPTTSDTITDRSGKLTHRISGVQISTISEISDWAASGETLDIHYGFFHTRRIRAADLAPSSTPLIVTMVDNRPVDRDSLFYVLIRTRTDEIIRMRRVTQIRMRSDK